ncbi:MAG TPA: hypothetical protein VN625_02675, partial [Desulfuromonadaceae bacterium]|nr:hypothetical protein [Desulfuromonadaceae bacterium]
MKVMAPAMVFLALAISAGWAQPHVAYVYPAGGQVGTTFEIVVGGQNLMSVSNAMMTGDGVVVTVLDRNRPISQKDFGLLRDRWMALQDREKAANSADPGTNTWTTADIREREEIRNKILKNPPNRKTGPAMIETVTLRVEIATNAATGDREIRLLGQNALSNPLTFRVGALPEESKSAAQAFNPDLEPFLKRLGRKPVPVGTPKYEATVSLPVTVNGQIMPGEVDRFHFVGKRGQQIVIMVEARALIPYLADAVPGWFEAVLTIFDSRGHELASDERFRFKPDPAMRFEVPEDGDYTVEIHDSIFRGREDFVYRLTMGELPFVTSIFPLGGKAGDKTEVAVSGWNLGERSVVRDNPPGATGVAMLSDRFPVPFAVDELPEQFEREPNDSRATAQAVDLSAIVNGKIGRRGETDVFSFKGVTGQRVVAEVMARRLDSPLDSFLRLMDAEGKLVASNDDFDDKGSGLETHHADSYLTAVLPADGIYFVEIGDTQARGGSEFGYRLRLSGPRPDFALWIVPASVTVHGGMSAPLTVYALRKDGFTNAINLKLKDESSGFSLSGSRIGINQDKVQITLKASTRNTGMVSAVELVGEASVDGRLVRREVLPAEDMMQ